MKNSLKKSLLTLTVVFTLLGIFTSTAFAYSSYDGGYNQFDFAASSMGVAQRCFSDRGYANPCYFHLDDFYKNTIQVEVPLVRCFYADTHGTTSHMLVTYESDKSFGYTSAGSLYSWTKGFYKFVFLDACYLGDTDEFFKAFNMNYGDGLNHAYLGWKDKAADDYNYYTFAYTVFDELDSGKTVNDSVWDARVESGCTNYAIYGNYNTTMTN